jgi:hypothetical protein
MGRKTFDVRKFVNNANERLAGWTETAEMREGIIVMVGEVLHATGNYNGFNYLSEGDLTDGARNCAKYFKKMHNKDIDMRPGIRSTFGKERMVDGVDTWFEDTDPTRVYYYLPKD